MRELRRRIAAMASVALLASPATPAHAAEAKRFPTAEAAIEAFVAALKSEDPAATGAVLGGENLLASGDQVADAADRSSFLEAYATRHALVPAADGSVVLSVGESDWPLPIPVVQRNGEWSFDTQAGVAELNYRRIGRNEFGAIGVCRGVVRAEQEYAAAGHDGLAVGAYASKLRSDPGRHNGLYWETAPDEPLSPLGSLVAEASAEGYAPGKGKPATYHGYVYRLLPAQGSNAQDGARSYAVDGVWRNGFAVLATPAEYGASGVMTFSVNQDGVVFQKDLGEDTAALAAKIADFDPDRTWTPVP